MLTKDISLKICNFVAQKPRTIQEIAHLIGRNWRTANSYIEKIILEEGTLGCRTFRGGTKGALKIVFWNMISKNQSKFQDLLFHKIISTTNSKDFSPFDIYQHVENDYRESFIEEQEKNINIRQNLIGTILSAKKQLLIFSGDLSWAKAKQNNKKLISIFEKLAKDDVSIKIIANVDLSSLANIEHILSINSKLGKEIIEIRHSRQPLRSFIIDDSFVRFKEKYFFKSKAVNKYLFYSITDENWINWTKKIFWHYFSSSISAEKRIEDLKSIQ